jgi:hypothetical protein
VPGGAGVAIPQYELGRLRRQPLRKLGGRHFQAGRLLDEKVAIPQYELGRLRLRRPRRGRAVPRGRRSRNLTIRIRASPTGCLRICLALLRPCGRVAIPPYELGRLRRPRPADRELGPCRRVAIPPYELGRLRQDKTIRDLGFGVCRNPTIRIRGLPPNLWVRTLSRRLGRVEGRARDSDAVGLLAAFRHHPRAG